jgi:hypothetical protein
MRSAKPVASLSWRGSKSIRISSTDEPHLRHVLLSYMTYYNEARTHLSLDKDAPVGSSQSLISADGIMDRI